MHSSVQRKDSGNKKGKSYKDLPFGPSGEIRTHGLMVPNHARYQLRYTRIWTFTRSASQNISIISVFSPPVKPETKKI